MHRGVVDAVQEAEPDFIVNRLNRYLDGGPKLWLQ